jgi:2-phosphoglycerate kinase
VADAAARLRHVYWIGGGSGAGKSVIARRMAARHRLRLYATDDVMADHGRRCAPADGPYLTEFAAMDMDERWVNRSPESMLETFHWFRGEGFGLIVEDLLRRPAEPGVIAEGFRLLPRLVQPRRKFMNDTVLPGAADRATALFTAWIEGHYDQVVAGFTPETP